MLFLWGLLGTVMGALALLLVPLRLSSVLHWPGYSEARVCLGPWRVSHWQAAGPRWRRLLPQVRRLGEGGATGKGVGKGHAGSGPPLRALWAESDGFFARLRRIPMQGVQLEAEGGVGDPAVTAVLYGAAWALLGGLLAGQGQQVVAKLTPRFEGPATGRLDARAEVSVTLGRLMLAALWGMEVLRGTP